MIGYTYQGCTLCANGNDLPDGEYCRACGLGLEIRQPKEVEEESNLAKAIKAARGGDAPPSYIPWKP